MRLSIVVLMLFVAACATVLPAAAQTASSAACPACREPNDEANNFCTSCGVALRKREEEKPERPSGFFRPQRLFSMPAAEAMAESYLGFAFGNDFGVQAGESILGTATLGVGDLGEMELSTAGLVKSVVSNRTSFRTAGMKIRLLEEEGLKPSMAIALRSSNDWQREERGDRIIATSEPSAYDIGLRELNFESRITTLGVFLSKHMRQPTTIHAGVGFSDIRYRNVYSGFVDTAFTIPGERRANQWQAYLGATIEVNERTTVMGEVQTVPLFKFDRTNKGVRLSRMYVAAGGVRFSLTRSWSLDGGIRYQDNFVGLADIQFHASVNAIIVLN